MFCVNNIDERSIAIFFHGIRTIFVENERDIYEKIDK